MKIPNRREFQQIEYNSSSDIDFGDFINLYKKCTAKIRDEKLKYDINIDAAKISALSSGEIDKYEYHTGEEILPSDQRIVIEQAKFTYSPLGKAFEEQGKNK